MSNFLVGTNTADVQLDKFSGNASTVAFTLSVSSSTFSALVRISGVVQTPVDDFNISGTSIVFTSSPPSGSNNIVVTYTKATQIGVPNDASVSSVKIQDGAITASKIATGVVPDGVTVSATAPSSPATGDLWYDPDTGDGGLSLYNGTAWVVITNNFVATGGTILDHGIYRSHLFTSSGTFQASGAKSIDYCIIAGGGAGATWHGGGGGAGGMQTGTITTSAQAYTVVVGAGGAGGNGSTAGSNGSPSSAFGITSIGGGRGGSYNFEPGQAGGSGGGGVAESGVNGVGGAGTSGQGNNGGTGITGHAGGGGGGKGSVGVSPTNAAVAGNGGTGAANDYESSVAQRYAGGGGGGCWGGTGGVGVDGGGQGSATGNGTRPTSGAVNTGGGCGGFGGQGNAASMAAFGGGSGVVIIRYAI